MYTEKNEAHRQCAELYEGGQTIQAGRQYAETFIGGQTMNGNIQEHRQCTETCTGRQTVNINVYRQTGNAQKHVQADRQ